RFHDLRHHAITELAESCASEHTIVAIAGHVSRRMLERYSHIRLEAKRNALHALSRPKKEGYGTNGGTKTDKKVSVPPISQEIVIGTCGFEPQTPTVSRRAKGLPTPSTTTNQPKTKPYGRRKSIVKAVRTNGSREKGGND